MKNFFGEEIDKSVFISEDQLKRRTKDKLYGKYYYDTGIFNIFPEDSVYKGDFLCNVIYEDSDILDKGLSAKDEKGILAFYFDGKKIKVEYFSIYQNIFSRNKGILETSKMKDRSAVILGCGSVGSLVSMELARSGIGKLFLVDADIVEYHNVCRHQCGIDDVGDLKINALERKLKNINPEIIIKKFNGIVENLPKESLDIFCNKDNTIFIGCADNRTADVYANKVSMYYESNFISIGFWERAYAGEIFYHLYGKKMPCYQCAIGNGGNLSQRAQANHHVYSNEENIETLNFEPGISVDINFITSIGIKLAIDILNINNEGFIPRLLNNLKQYTLICNTDNTEIAGQMVGIFSYPLQVTTSLVVGFNGEKCKENNACWHEKIFMGSKKDE